jgi:hypothetical protein
MTTREREIEREGINRKERKDRKTSNLDSILVIRFFVLFAFFAVNSL